MVAGLLRTAEMTEEYPRVCVADVSFKLFATASLAIRAMNALGFKFTSIEQLSLFGTVVAWFD